jgi:hypothetical protein
MNSHIICKIDKYIPLTLYPRRGNIGISDINWKLNNFGKTPTLYQIYLAMTNTADVTCGKPIAVLL